MRSFTSILLIGCLLVFFFGSIGTYISYQVNYDYISGTLCINKARPALQCNGKCHLKKELSKQEESQPEKQAHQKISQEMNFLCEGEGIIPAPANLSRIATSSSYFICTYQSPFTRLYSPPWAA